MENENVENKTAQVAITNVKKTPRFFVDKNELQITVYIIFNSLDGNILSVNNTALDNTFIQGIEQIGYKFVFTKPNYQQISRYKQLSMYWDNIALKTIVNPFKMRNYIILNHLKRWQNVVDDNGQEVNLEIDIDDTLTQKSLDLVYTVNSAIIDCVMKEFQKVNNIIL